MYRHCFFLRDCEETYKFLKSLNIDESIMYGTIAEIDLSHILKENQVIRIDEILQNYTSSPIRGVIKTKVKNIEVNLYKESIQDDAGIEIYIDLEII